MIFKWLMRLSLLVLLLGCSQAVAQEDDLPDDIEDPLFVEATIVPGGNQPPSVQVRGCNPGQGLVLLDADNIQVLDDPNGDGVVVPLEFADPGWSVTSGPPGGTIRFWEDRPQRVRTWGCANKAGVYQLTLRHDDGVLVGAQSMTLVVHPAPTPTPLPTVASTATPTALPPTATPIPTATPLPAPTATLVVLVCLNTGTSAQLQTLPGIGPVLAWRIMTYRTQFGFFQTVDDLNNVTGIGPVTVNTLRPFASLC